jgi:ABC-type dipeptide/oligopeptide/nickel transport system permease component
MGMFLLRRFFSSVVILFGATYIMYILTAYSGDPLEDLTQSTARNKEELIARRIEILDLKMPAKVLRKILDEFKQNDEECLSIVDQGIINILEIPELSKLYKQKFQIKLLKLNFL